jgi:aspartate aminotransferase
MDKQGKGAINPNLRSLGESATLAMSERVRAMRQQGVEVLSLGIGESPFPVPDFIQKALKANAGERSYLPVKGLPELRQAVAGYHKRVDGLDFKPDNIIIGPGTKILMYLLQLTHDGEIIVPSPCWVSYVPQANLIGKKSAVIMTSFEERWRLDPGRLEDALRSGHDPAKLKMLVLNYPGNPEGGTYSASELRALAQVARQYSAIVLSDEIYGEVNHAGNHVSIAKFYPEGTIVSGGLSKWAAAGGWRLGTFAFPDELGWLLGPMTKAAGQTFSSVASPVQFAGITAFNGSPELDDYLLHARRIFSALSAKCAGMLRDSGANIHNPEGAFYLFPDFGPLADGLRRRGIGTGQQLCEAILNEKHVATIPGVSFFRPADELTIRMSYTNFDGAKAMKASRKVQTGQRLDDEFLADYCGKTLEATERICDLVSGSG